MRAARLYLSEWAKLASRAILVGSALAASIVGVRLLTASPVTPTPAGWMVLALVGAVGWGPILLPAAAAWGAVEVLGRWSEDGSWLGIRSCGGRGRQWVAGMLVAGLFAAVPTAALTLDLEPRARAAARRLAPGFAAIGLREGVPFAVGALVAVPHAGGVWLDGGGVVVRAGSVGIQPGALVLRDGLARGPGFVARFDWWVLPVDPPAARVELDERDDADLRRFVAATEARGDDASYERAVLYKRYLHPVAALAVPLATTPMGRLARRGAAVLAVGVGWLVAVRLGDGLSEVVGPWTAAAGPLWLGLVGIGRLGDLVRPMNAADRVLARQSAGVALGVSAAVALAAVAVDSVELLGVRGVPADLVAGMPMIAAVAGGLVVARWRSSGVWDGLVAVGARPSRLAGACAVGLVVVAALVVLIGALAPGEPADRALVGDALVHQRSHGWERIEVRGGRLEVGPADAPPPSSRQVPVGAVVAAGLMGLGGAASAARGGLASARWIAGATVWQLVRIGVDAAVSRGAWPPGWLLGVWILGVLATARAVRVADA